MCGFAPRLFTFMLKICFSTLSIMVRIPRLRFCLLENGIKPRYSYNGVAELEDNHRKLSTTKYYLDGHKRRSSRNLATALMTIFALCRCRNVSGKLFSLLSPVLMWLCNVTARMAAVSSLYFIFLNSFMKAGCN